MDSIWLKTAKKPRFDALDENKKTDVLIIGGGIAGILCAYKLKNAGIECMLAEATEICGGTFKRQIKVKMACVFYGNASRCSRPLGKRTNGRKS